jgi:hypothetical protein
MHFILWLSMLFLMVPAYAGVFKCTDNQGKTIYRSSPCLDGQNKEELDLKTGIRINLDEKAQQAEQNNAEQEKKSEQLQQDQDKLTQLKQQAAAESAKNQFLIKNNPEKFSSFAIPPYSLNGLPELVKPFQNRLAEIERFRRLAAEKALTTKSCKRVEGVELSKKSNKGKLVFMINCSTGNNFEFSEQELSE